MLVHRTSFITVSARGEFVADLVACGSAQSLSEGVVFAEGGAAVE